MKLLRLYLVVFISCISCNSKNHRVAIQELVPTQQIAKGKQYRYYIGLGVYLPFELYVNDILIKYGTTGVSSAVELNPWLLRNGTHKVTIKFFPDVGGHTVVNMGKEQLPYRIDFNKVVINESRDIVKQEKAIKLPLLTKDEDLPYFEQSWDIEITDLPYVLEGWSNGQDLSKWNQEVLEKKVVAYYEKLRTILNDGDAERWFKLDEKRDIEIDVFDYSSPETIQREFDKNSRRIREYAKGNMIPLEDYKMKVYGKNNQLVTLERNATNGFRSHMGTNIKYMSPIMFDYEGAIRGYPVKLYLPKGSDEFVIIRK
ncbi:conserved hypothetical protein [Tenacibaculum maritimum]|uniref:hypothetical protein n=1 Tax=Tenacibaculum maritimum TaxID=107401 RepID=UPI0012E57414|nr:hypothetical protein [Tenacibaculum maritimum]CAA0223859.1 conserved hypothetical protein [Tenacibaculum maritimum]CAA0259272.1 conserved hypothetical protein [Tenacibaculum maritimum]